MGGSCKDCRHWESGVNGYMGDESFTWGDCAMASATLKSKALAQPTEDHETHEIGGAVLLTRRDFSCVQFESSRRTDREEG